MKKEERLSVYARLKKNQGIHFQLDKIQEELIELLEVVTKLKKVKRPDKLMISDLYNLVDEVADVKMAIEKLELFFPIEKAVEMRLPIKVKKAESTLDTDIE